VGTATAAITVKTLTGSFTANSKQYDGSISATVASRSVSGNVGSDDVSLSGGTATFDNANAGTGKTVTLAGATLAGTDAGNYTLGIVLTTTANITPAGSSFTGVGYTSGTENNIAANGLSNLMNYALGQNGPNAPFPAKPVLRTDSSGMILTATARTDDSSLRFYVEWTTDLSGVTDRWDLHTTEVSPPDLTGTIAYGELRKFLRFKVTK
jgi:hypothetical protein